MSSSIAAFPPAIRPMVKPRHFSSLASSLAAPRALAPKILTPSSILSRNSVSFDSIPFVSTKAVDKIRRTDGDGNLLRVIENEIKRLQEADEQEAELPKDSPFEIIDIHGKESFQYELEREFQGEKIEVFVSKYYDGIEDEEESKQDAAEGQNTDGYRQPHIYGYREPHIPLIVTIVKAGLTLKFWCELHAEDFKIAAVRMKSEDSDAEGHGFLNFDQGLQRDEGLQRALNKYLRLRGIKVPLYEFSWKYFMKADIREYIVWWKKLKEFVEK